MARLVAYQEDLSESTASGSTVTKASLSADLVNGTTYALIWSYQVGSNDTSSIARMRCMDATGNASRGLNQFRARDTSDYNWAGNVGIYTATSTASRTFHIEFLRLSGTGTVKIKNVRLLVLELTAADAAAATVGNQVTASATFVSALDLNFTPATSGDYLFIASGAIINGSTEIEFLTPGATSVNNLNAVLPYAGLYQPWSVVWRENGIAASPQTASIRWRSNGGSQNLQAACIVAIRIDGLAGFQNTQDDSADGGTDTSYTATESLAATGLQPDVRDTIVIAAATVADGSTSDSSFVEFREAGTQIIEGIHEASGSLTTTAGLIGYKVSGSSTSITFDLRRKSESTNTTTVEFASIAVLELAPPQEGAAALTEDDDSVSATSTLLLQASASITQDNDVVSAVIGLTPAFADASITEADDSVSSAGVLPITGSASITGDDDSLTGAGALFILGTGSALEDDDSVASAAALLIQGGAAIDEGADLISAEGALLIVGAANLVEDDDSVVANDFVPRGRADLYEEDDFLRFHGGISAEWMQEQATKGDIPNWNQCARCHKEMRPNQLLAERRRVGSSVIWTGLRVCSDCLDPIHPQDRQPRVMGGDPRPVPNARPFRGS